MVEGPPGPATSEGTAGSTSRQAAVASEDALLLDRWRAGDREAGGRLVRRHHASIAGFFASSSSADERQDLTQQTFERITRGKHCFRGDCSVRTYFFRVAHGVLVDHLRRRYRKDFDPLTHSVMDLGAITPSRVFVELERTHALLACMRALPLETKLLLELYYWNGLTAVELGEVFEVPEGTIRRRVFDAKAKLRAALRGSGAELDDTGLAERLAELGTLLAKGPTSM